MPKEKQLQYIQFVRPKTDTESFSKQLDKKAKRKTSSVSDGKEVKKFYSDLLSEDSTPGSSKVQTRSNSAKSVHQDVQSQHFLPTNEDTDNGSHTKKDLASVNQKIRHQYFKAVEEGNIKEISRLLDNGVDINAVDEHGWTALMCACCSGHLSVVNILVQRDANVNIVNKKGQTALVIAQKSKKANVVKLLTEGIPEQSAKTGKTGSKHKCFYCNVCKKDVSGFSMVSHNTSMVHLLNLKLIPKQQDYVLPENNAGFQMMLKSGWDQEKGLGSLGQGRKHPVKTVLKRDRLGLGSKAKTEARVTHFAPKDKTAVKDVKEKRSMKVSTISKRKQSAHRRKERAKEMSFRREFY